VDYLLRAGARIDAKDGEGMSGLHQAAWYCDLDTVRLLLDRGAPLEATNVYGGTVLGSVVWAVRNAWVEGRDYPAVVETLIAAGADLEAVHGLPTGRPEVDEVFRRVAGGRVERGRD
jgi:ankyrin repeat protein